MRNESGDGAISKGRTQSQWILERIALDEVPEWYKGPGGRGPELMGVEGQGAYGEGRGEGEGEGRGEGEGDQVEDCFVGVREPEQKWLIGDLVQSNREILAQYPPSVVVPGIMKQYAALREREVAEGEHGKGRVSRAARVLARKNLSWLGELGVRPVMAVIALVVLVVGVLAGVFLTGVGGGDWYRGRGLAGAGAGAEVASLEGGGGRSGVGTMGGAGAGAEPGIRIKGLKPSLHVYRKVSHVAEELNKGETVFSGDVIQVGYWAAGATYGAIVSIDGRGAYTVHFPDNSPLRAGRLQTGGEILLNHSYQLDDAPRFERFYFVTSSSNFAMEEVRKAVIEVFSHQNDEEPRLQLPEDFKSYSFVVKKGRR